LESELTRTLRLKPSTLKVLIIDDSPDDRAEMRRMLLTGSKTRYRFVEAELGADGLRLFRDGQDARPDVVLLDYHLPDMNAEDVLAQLRNGAELPPCPVVVLTGSEADAGAELLRAGAQDYLGKTWTTAESLTRAVENSIERFALLSERTRTAEQLRASEARFRQIANTMPQIAWAARPDGYIDYYNERWYEFTGFLRHEFGESSWEPILHPDDVQRCMDTYFGCIRSGKPYRIEYRFKDRASGGYRWFMGQALPVRDERGEITRWFGTSTDIDDQKRAEEKLEAIVTERTAKLQETIAELESYSYSISHDMRSPLRGIQGFAQVLEEECRAEIGTQGREYIRRIVTSAERMDRLIQDVLVYSRVARSDIVLENIDLMALLNGILESYPQFQLPKAEVTMAFPLPPVRGNVAALTQCLSNLVGNAVTFVPPGVVPHVKISAVTRDKRVRVSIQDNGIGIDPKMHEKIFGIFHRLSRDYEGTGIGLAVVRRAAERMGGAILVESELGKGTTFHLELNGASSE